MFRIIDDKMYVGADKVEAMAVGVTAFSKIAVGDTVVWEQTEPPINTTPFDPYDGVVSLVYTYDTSLLFTGYITSYTLTGTLPTGLEFDSVTGIISGTVSTAQTSGDLSVTATNAAGSDTTNTATMEFLEDIPGGSLNITANRTVVSGTDFPADHDINVCMVGGGGSGAFWVTTNAASGGGHSGQVVDTLVNLADAVSVVCTIGTGGTGVPRLDPGNPGTPSSFGSHATSTGGNGGSNDDTVPTTDYNGNGAARNTCGGNSNDGSVTLFAAKTGGQGSGFGNGGNAGDMSGAGGAGGVGAGGGSGMTNGYSSGAGGRGQINLQWDSISPPIPPIQAPRLVGLTAAEADIEITNAGLVKGTVTGDIDPVISQDPLSGANIDIGGTINYELTLDDALVSVPVVVGLTEAQATTDITDVGLIVGTVDGDIDPVESQDPTGGTRVSLGTAVNLTLSPDTVSVPNIVGLTSAAADAAITDARLVVGTVGGEVDPVVSQSPLAGTQVLAGTTVNYVLALSIYPEVWVNVDRPMNVSQEPLIFVHLFNSKFPYTAGSQSIKTADNSEIVDAHIMMDNNEGTVLELVNYLVPTFDHRQDPLGLFIGRKIKSADVAKIKGARLSMHYEASITGTTVNQSVGIRLYCSGYVTDVGVDECVINTFPPVLITDGDLQGASVAFDVNDFGGSPDNIFYTGTDTTFQNIPYNFDFNITNNLLAPAEFASGGDEVYIAVWFSILVHQNLYPTTISKLQVKGFDFLTDEGEPIE